MDIGLILENLTSPALLFFILGIIATQIKSDFEIPPNSSKFISIYLLFSIGFKGGHELSHAVFDSTIGIALLSGILLSMITPILSFFILKPKLGVFNAGAISASYGSVSAVTFITLISYLELNNIPYGSYMVAVMALMEAPAIIVGNFLISMFKKNNTDFSLKKTIHHSLTNSSVLIVLGSLIIGFITNDTQAMGIQPFTTDIFKGFLVLFLLDMGVKSGRNLKAMFSNGIFPFLFAILFPLFIGSFIALISGFFFDEGDRLIITILAASASYIAVPAAMKMSVPKANPGLYIPMALAITFPFNITFGIPIFHAIINFF